MTDQSKAVTKKKPETIRQLLTTYKSQIAAALPRHITPERMSRVALTAIHRSPKLLSCDPISLFGAIIQASQLGLEIGPGGAHLVPYGKEVQMIADYRGLMSLARQSGEIDVFYAQAVHQNDEFLYQYGTNYNLFFKPAERDRGPITHVFAIAHFKHGGAYQFEVMSVDAVAEIRDRSTAKDKGPWQTDYEAMAKKTVIRQLCKFLPVSIELQQAVSLDERAEMNKSQNNRAIIEGELDQVLTETGKPDVEMPQAV